MRISDWSSDVCSSDLFFRAYTDELDVSHVFDGLGERFHIGDILVKGYAAAARVHSAVEAMFDLRRKHGFTGDDIESAYVGIPKVIQGRLTNRSEEHTSELQSLMRISYAVFCLKKKKNNKR